MNEITKEGRKLESTSDTGLESKCQYGLILKNTYIQINTFKNKCRCMYARVGHMHIFPYPSAEKAEKQCILKSN